MKKYMVADLIKAVEDEQAIERTKRIKDLLDTYGIAKTDAEYIVDNYSDYTQQDLIAKAMESFDLNIGDAETFVDDNPNESTWADLEEVAESLGVDITDVEDDDVENYMSMGGNKGILKSSSGIIQWIYDNTLKAYVILMVLEDKPIMYKLDPTMMKEWKDSESIGEYYNLKIRGNSQIEDDEIACGCNPNPCEQGQVDRFNTRFVSIS